MSNIQFVEPPAALYSVPTVRFGTVEFLNWAGYYTKNSTFTVAAATYNFAAINGPPSPPCTADGAVGAWTGLGGVNTGNLAQNGTAIGTPGLGNNQGWWEILPAAPVAVPIYATWNKNFTVTTTHNAAGSFTFVWTNTHTYASFNWTQPSNSYDGSTADFVIERPTINGGWEPMSQLLNPQTFKGWANTNPLGVYSWDKVHMENILGQRLFTTSALQGDLKSFTTTQIRCQ